VYRPILNKVQTDIDETHLDYSAESAAMVYRDSTPAPRRNEKVLPKIKVQARSSS
jgi:hypothetical protein